MFNFLFFRFFVLQRVQSATTILNNCRFINNTADRGGAVYLKSTTSTIKDSVIEGNTANSFGGGIYILSAALHLQEGVSVVNNYAANYGGGFYMKWGLITMTDSSYTSDNTAGSGTGDVGNEIKCIQANAQLSDTSRFETLAQNPLLLLEEDIGCKDCVLNQNNIGFDYCDPDYSNVIFGTDSDGDTIDVEGGATTGTVEYGNGTFSDGGSVIVDTEDTPSPTISDIFDQSVTTFYDIDVRQPAITITSQGEAPAADKFLSATVDITDPDLIAEYESNENAVYVIYITCWETFRGNRIQLFIPYSAGTYVSTKKKKK